jgi:hypothetical protein
MELLTIHEKKVLTINWGELLHCSNRRRIWKFAQARLCLVEAGAHPVAGAFGYRFIAPASGNSRHCLIEMQSVSA